MHLGSIELSRILGVLIVVGISISVGLALRFVPINPLIRDVMGVAIGWFLGWVTMALVWLLTPPLGYKLSAVFIDYSDLSRFATVLVIGVIASIALEWSEGGITPGLKAHAVVVLTMLAAVCAALGVKGGR